MKAILITSSILILLLAALRPLLRGRFDPRVQYALWAVVALRLLVPVEWASSSFSAMNLVNRAEEQTHLAQSIGRASVPLPVQSYEAALDMAIQEYQRSRPMLTDVPALTSEEGAKLDSRARELQARGPTLAQLAEQYAKPLWLGGAALTAVWFLLVNFKLRRKLRTALPVAVDCPLPVRVTPDLPSPCLCGVLRPAVYLTPDALAEPDRTRHVLAHELTHYRHRDHWWALARCLCLCLYWFDPLVWWAAAMSRQDCELACDAGAIRRLGEEERIPYGRTLVTMIAAGRSSLLQTATTMTGGKRRVRERVELIARRPKTAIALTLAAALLVGLAVGCTFTGAPEDNASGLSAAVTPTAPDPQPLSSDGLNTATLPSRLMDVPDELRADVEAARGGEHSIYDGVLVEYWLKRPWTDYSEHFGWLLTVYQWTSEQLEERYENTTGTWECIAKDGQFYYVLMRATDVRWPATPEMLDDFEGATQADIDNNLYITSFAAVRQHAIEAVLETGGTIPIQNGLFEPDQVNQLSDAAWDVKSVVDQLVQSSWVRIRDSQSRPSVGYATNPRYDHSTGFLASMPTAFLWEEFDWGTTEDPHFPQTNGLPLLLVELINEEDPSAETPHYVYDYDSSDNMLHIVYIHVWEGTDLVAVHDARGGTRWYHAQYNLYHGADYESPGPYEYLKYWFDALDSCAPPATGRELEPIPMYFSPPRARGNLDATLLNSPMEAPNDPETWSLVAQLPGEPVWIYSRDHGSDIMFQFDDLLSDPVRYRAYNAGYHTVWPKMMRLEGGGNLFGTIAVISHLFQGGTDQQYQLVVHDFNRFPEVTSYAHDWESLMTDFNENCTARYNPIEHCANVTYQGQTVRIELDEIVWDYVQEDGFRAGVLDTDMRYFFNDDGTATLVMPVWGPGITMPVDLAATWTVRFTGSSFETEAFQFQELDAAAYYVVT